MKIILLEDVKNIGSRDDVREVGDGYAMNFLIPQKKALEVADEKGKQALRQSAEKKERQKKKEEKEQEAVTALPETVKISAAANEKGSLFSAITVETVVDHLKKQGTPIPKERITIPTIKKVGEHAATIKTKESEKTLTITVEREK